MTSDGAPAASFTTTSSLTLPLHLPFLFLFASGALPADPHRRGPRGKRGAGHALDPLPVSALRSSGSSTGPLSSLPEARRLIAAPPRGSDTAPTSAPISGAGAPPWRTN